MNRSSIVKSFSFLTILTLFEKIIAFVFQAILAALLGTNAITDAYFSASELFGVLEVTAISSLTVAVLNRFSYHLKQDGEHEAFEFLSNLLSFYLPIISVLSIGIFVFASPLSHLTAPGFSAEARQTLVQCIRIMAVIPLIECVTAIGLAVLRQKRRFGLTSLKSLFISVVGIIAVFIFHKIKVNSAIILSASYGISMLMFCILTMLYTSKYGKVRLVKPQFNIEIRGTIRMVLPLIVSYGITRTTLMIGKIIASFLGDGAVSQLTYAHNLYAVVSAVFITNLTVILLTDFNEMIAEKAFLEVGIKIQSVASIMTAMLIPITIVSIICSKDIVSIIYERGQFTVESTESVAGVLAIYALNFIPAMIHGIYNQVLYAKGDTKTPMWIAMVSIVVNFSVSLLLTSKIGLRSVAVGSLISSIIAILLCGFKIRECIPGFKGCYNVKFFVVCIVAGSVCTLGTIFINNLQLPAVLSFVVSTVISFGLFGTMLLLLKEKNVISLFKIMQSKIKTHK